MSNSNLSGIQFATGGTTKKSRFVLHPWENFEYSCKSAAKAFEKIKAIDNANVIANCFAAGNLWGDLFLGKKSFV